MQVKRRSGRREPFVKEKIVAAIMKSGGKPETARAVAHAVESDLTKGIVVTTAKLRTAVLSKLRQKDARTYRSWLAYDKKNKRWT